MSKKRKKTKDAASQTPRTTKKQIAFTRKEARQNRIIWLLVAVLGLIILIVLAIGLAREFALQPATPVAQVNGVKIRTDDYENLLQYRRYNTRLNILNLQNELNALDPNQEGNEFLSTFYQQQLEQLQASEALLPQNTLDELIDDALVREKAEESGITVTDEEVSQTIDEDVQRAASPPPQAPITDTGTVSTPTPIPQERLDEIYQNALDNMGLTDKQFGTIVKRSLYRSRVDEFLASQVVTTGLVVHAQLIQTDTEEESTVALDRVEAGEDFAIVAREVSTDTITAGDGGDLGWATAGQLAPRYGQDLETEVFALDVGQIKIVQSNNAYYVIMLLERDENGPLPADVLDRRRSMAFSDWLAERKTSPEVEIERFLRPDQIAP
jgi:parvulin-like peptidyl-prolyl isomerase